LAAELSQERKREEENRRYYSDTSLNSPLNQAIAAQKTEANRPFIPTTTAYPLASQNQTSFASPAAAYMRERQLEREQEQVARGLLDETSPARVLLDETSPARVTNKALRDGNAVGDNNRERSFLERLAQSGLLSVLQGMARAERQYGVGPLAAFSESALDVQAAQQAQEAAEAKAQREQEELDIARQRAAAATLSSEATMEKATRPPKGARLTGKALIEAIDNVISASKNVKKARGDKTRLTALGDEPTDKEFNTIIRARAMDIYNANPNIGTEEAVDLALGVGQAQPATDPFENVGK
tara:strand:+ start:157 stop:1053 length:897 start_codon:yes stop_codon:yes gene_type:complete